MTRFAHDSDLRPTSITAAGVQNLAFTYDTADRLTQITNGVHSSYTQTLGYDALDRLTSVSSSAHTAGYTYDGDGNRTYQAVNGVVTNFAYTATSNRLNSAAGGVNAAYGYNAYGSTTTVNGATAYTYDPFGRLANASGAVSFPVKDTLQNQKETSRSIQWLRDSSSAAGCRATRGDALQPGRGHARSYWARCCCVFSNAASCSGVASFWYRAFHSANGMP